MARPHAALLLEDAWHRRLTGFLGGRGWTPRVIGYTGYGSPRFVRVLARVVLSRHALDPDDQPLEVAEDDIDPSDADRLRQSDSLVRGWRAFVTAQAMDVPCTVRVGDVDHRAVADRSGYLDIVLKNHGLAPGWHEVTVTPDGGDGVPASVVIIDPSVTFGLVSDIDDTIITTYLPRPLIAAWNTFVRHEEARNSVQGMAPMYRDLLAEHPGAPIFYLSTGAWNTAPTLTRFLKRHGYPMGPLLLTDWGPTNTGWFRSGQEHKRIGLHRLAREFPHIRWVLVGDDGQHDPRLYGDFARDRPDVVRAIGIRELSPAEQVLSHGIPMPTEPGARRVRREVEVVRAPDGYDLLPLLQAAIARS